MRRFTSMTSTIAVATLAAGALLPRAALAAGPDFGFVPNPQQSDFRSVVEDLSAVFNAKSLAPAEAGGVTGFAIGAYGSYVPTDSSAAWKRLVLKDVTEVGLVGVVAQKGLPFGIDVGASFSAVPSTDAKLFSAELRYAILEGGIAEPALALRGSYSKLSGVDQLDYDGYGLDMSISKGFGPLTPYAGVGYAWNHFEADPQFNLKHEDVDKTRVFIGLRLSALFGITPEYERVGDRNAYNLRVGFAF